MEWAGRRGSQLIKHSINLGHEFNLRLCLLSSIGIFFFQNK